MSSKSHDDDEWRQRLSEQQYAVTRKGATEPPFSGKYYTHKEKGSYHCICCGAELFGSTGKYDSGCGWPSFWEPAKGDNVRTLEDRSHGMVRTEIRCAECDAHLGHVFPDGATTDRPAILREFSGTRFQVGCRRSVM